MPPDIDDEDTAPPGTSPAPSGDDGAPCRTEPVTDDLSKCLSANGRCPHALTFGWYVYCGHPLHRRYRK